MPEPLLPPRILYLIPSEGSCVALIFPEDPEASCEGVVCGALAVDWRAIRFFVAAVDQKPPPDRLAQLNKNPLLW